MSLRDLLRGNGGPSKSPDEAALRVARERMVAEQIAQRGVRDERVLDAMRRVERHRFLPRDRRAEAYGDHPVPIGQGQTISQPYIVAYMTAALVLQSHERALEVGAGSGYQSAILAELAEEVYSVEYFPDLAENARKLLGELGYTNVRIKTGDGRKGWPEYAPFDAILMAAACPSVPPPLLEQLADGGRLVAPVGSVSQDLELHTRSGDEIRVERLVAVRFVPLLESKEEDR